MFAGCVVLHGERSSFLGYICRMCRVAWRDVLIFRVCLQDVSCCMERRPHFEGMFAECVMLHGEGSLFLGCVCRMCRVAWREVLIFRVCLQDVSCCMERCPHF